MKKIIIMLVFVLGLTLPPGSIAEGYSTYDMTGIQEMLETNPLDREYTRDTWKPEYGTILWYG